MLKVLFGLSMSETVFEKEGILEEVCRTPRATVLRLQHSRHGHVFLFQVRQQILVGRIPESDCVFVGCFFYLEGIVHLSPQRLQRKSRCAEE